MKILYAIQGTGNGHVSRAREVIPALKGMADVDVFLSGGNSTIDIGNEIKYFSKGVSFEYGKKGDLDYWKTFRKLQPARVLKEVREFPAEKYDLIINDFEFISAYAAKLKNVPCISFSHQASLLSNCAPRPNARNVLGEFILNHYAPTKYAVGLHFKQYDDFIFTPIIRKEIRQLNPIQLGHYTVYLPAVGTNELINVLSKIPDVRWEVFSRTHKFPYIEKNITIRPIQNDRFIESLASCQGLLCSAGFESPAEAMYLGKKLFVIPIAGQYEQQCNAEALREMNIPVSSMQLTELIPKLQQWINSSCIANIHYPDITHQIIEQLLFDPRPFYVPGLIAG